MLCIQKKIKVILCRVTFPFKHVVGGREAHKIVGVEFLVFPSLLRFPPYFVSHPFSPTISQGEELHCLGEGPMFGSNTKVGCPPIKTSMDDLNG